VLARALIHATYPDKLLPDDAAVPTAM